MLDQNILHTFSRQDRRKYEYQNERKPNKHRTGPSSY